MIDVSRQSSRPLPPPVQPGTPITALAPMQDVTDLAFMGVIAHYGSPDYYFTEYFRVHAASTLERHIVRSITGNPTGRPVFAQMIGESVPDLTRTARDLERLPVAGVDLNLGCPAPKIYKKNVGGGLLRDPAKINEIFGALRASIGGLFTVKTRIGFDDTANFDRVLDLVNFHGVDLLSVHGRTVKEMYRSEVHYDAIARAVAAVRCPVLANGNVSSATAAERIIRETGVAGVMVGRSAIRNPWIFRQIRERFSGRNEYCVTLGDVRGYIARLSAAVTNESVPDRVRCSKLKKYLNFIGQGVDPEGRFLHEMRRALTESELFAVCDRHLLTDPSIPFSPEPYAGVIARPNCETPHPTECALDSVTG
ncbi:MAG TPA: tRNA-dihydrouridine synthase family protein [Opitutaceae bacterium]